MPAIQVARTDTFETQRQKINQIGDQIFSISQGGSDLATGNLKLGDGTVSTPSLAFTNEGNLGLFRSETGVIQYVSDSKKLLDISSENTIFFKNIISQKNSLSSNGIFIISGGQNYEGGNYSGIPITGGTGTGATLIVDVEPFGGSITTQGEGYNPGSYSGVSLVGGSGTSAITSFNIDGIENGLITPGSGYIDDVYSDVPMTGGSGNGAIAEIVTINGEVATITFSDTGSGYVNGDVLSANVADLGGQGAGFLYEISTYPGVISDITFNVKGDGYLNGDVLRLPEEVTGISAVLPGVVSNISTTLDTQSTQITIASTVGIVQGMLITQDINDIGILDPTCTVASIDSATQLTLSVAPLVSGVASLTFSSANPQEVTVADSTVFNQGDVLTVTSGTGQLAPDTTVSNILDSTTIFISNPPTAAGPATLTATPPFGVGTQALEYTINAVGTVGTILIDEGGNGYSVGDVLSVSPTSLLQPILYNVSSQQTEKITFSPSVPTGTFQIGQSVNVQGNNVATAIVRDLFVSGGNIDYIIIDSLGLIQSDILEVTTNPSATGTVDLIETKNKYFIDLDDGNGFQYTPSFTLYSGNTYLISYPSDHPFAFSRSRDGKWDPENITGISATVDTTTKNVTVSSTTGILVGMSVVESGIGNGEIESDTVVEEVVDATTIIISKLPLNSGTMVLEFYGAEYTDGITRDGNINQLTFTVSDSTPSTLYYYCQSHSDMGGENGRESAITIDQNNPRLIGSGFSFGVSQITQENLVTINNEDGLIDCQSVETLSINSSSANISSVVSTNTNSTNITTTNITATDLTVQANSTEFTGNININNLATIDATSGNITTSGVLRTNDKLNVNNIGFIEDNEFYVTSGNLILRPATSQVVKVDSSSAFVIPSGPSTDRPSSLAQDGAIRFNTTTSQYEGYSAATSSWSSLGGVRDIDGNTYILAELTTGANDNTLWFFNDNINTLKLTNQFLDFRSVKKISSGRLGLPQFTTWTANTPVSIGQYIKYKNNLYEVTSAGTTATSGNEPTHTSGVANNGTAQLTWYSSSVSSLTFEEVEELRIGPSKDCPVIVGSELKLDDNTISTLVQDLVLSPNSGKKVSIDAPTSLVIPVGNTNQRGSASQGSIRYNTTISQFEGYSGANWSSLGGVRDVNGNTYIIPETSPGADENILYFYNDNVNTLQVTTTELDFTNIDTITTSGGNTLAINTNIITLDNSATTIDNTNSTSSFISTTKQYLDLGLSSGLNVDPVLRLDDQGDVYLNTGFGTGTFSGVKIFDGDLKDFELADYLVKTSVLSLEKGVSNSGAAILYDTATAKGCRVTVVSKSSVGKKSMVEYNVIDNGTDIFHNEFGSLNTSADGFDASFDITPSNETRITLTLSDDHATNDTVEITVLIQVVK